MRKLIPALALALLTACGQASNGASSVKDQSGAVDLSRVSELVCKNLQQGLTLVASKTEGGFALTLTKTPDDGTEMAQVIYDDLFARATIQETFPVTMILSGEADGRELLRVGQRWDGAETFGPIEGRVRYTDGGRPVSAPVTCTHRL